MSHCEPRPWLSKVAHSLFTVISHSIPTLISFSHRNEAHEGWWRWFWASLVSYPRARGTFSSILSHQGTSHTGNTCTAPSGSQTSHMHCVMLLVGEKTAWQSCKPCPGLWDTDTGGLDLWQALAVPGGGRDEQHHFWDFPTPSGTANQKREGL